MDYIKVVIYEALATEKKFENTALLIAKDEIKNIGTNPDIKHKSSWTNSLSSKEFALSIINHPFLGVDKNSKARIERDYPEQYEAYIKTSKKEWNNCLKSERQRYYNELFSKRSCVPIIECKKTSTIEHMKKHYWVIKEIVFRIVKRMKDHVLILNLQEAKKDIVYLNNT